MVASFESTHSPCEARLAVTLAFWCLRLKMGRHDTRVFMKKCGYKKPYRDFAISFVEAERQMPFPEDTAKDAKTPFDELEQLDPYPFSSTADSGQTSGAPGAVPAQRSSVVEVVEAVALVKDSPLQGRRTPMPPPRRKEVYTPKVQRALGW